MKKIFKKVYHFLVRMKETKGVYFQGFISIIRSFT